MGSASAELADEELNGQREPTATPAIWWSPHSHHGGRHFLKVISVSFANSQLTLGITCKTLFDSVLPPELEPAWMSGGERGEEHVSQLWGPDSSLGIPFVHAHHGPLAKPGQLSESVKEVQVYSPFTYFLWFLSSSNGRFNHRARKT